MTSSQFIITIGTMSDETEEELYSKKEIKKYILVQANHHNKFCFTLYSFLAPLK